MKREHSFREYCLTMLMLFVFISVAGQRAETFRLENEKVSATVTRTGLTTLISPADPYRANVVGSGAWCRPLVRYKILQGDWLEIFNGARSVRMNADSSVSLIDYQPGMPQRMEQIYRLTPDGIDIDIIVEATMRWDFTIGDMSVSFPTRSPGGGTPETIFEECYTQHQFISGNGSFVYYARPSGNPPYLMVLPKKGTRLEFFEGGSLYIHSFIAGNNVQSGTWRQEHTSRLVGAAGSGNERVEYGFKLRWASSYDEMREMLYREGLFDIRVVPGMSVPNDLRAMFSLHTKNHIDSIVPEFPGKTILKYLGEKLPGHHVYEVAFGKLGENMLTVYYGDGEKTYLEFFSTEPVETLIKKRASFIVDRQQHRDPTKWYNGLFSVYDMKNSILRSPDDTDGFDYWWGYVLTCDDPALCKAPYVAAKNVYFPVDREIEAVEYYIENFVWNKLQRTDTDDPYPYGIYGVPNWVVARDYDARAGVRSRQLDRMQVWRSYDYPHIFMMYYHMYEIARMYPEKVRYLDAAGYLERAFGTAKGFFLYPYEIWGEYYKAYEIGCYNELVLEKIITALGENGRQEDADWLRGEYEKKVKFFIYDNRYPFSSEYAFDRTAFESSHAFAKYGVLNPIKPDKNLWYDKTREVWYSHPEVKPEDARRFMDRQLYAGLTVRGWLETTYFQLGADNSMSYMAKMGGWSILDYGKYFADRPWDWLQLGYASYLSSWSLMNTGTPESDYGFWAPGKQNDGAMGWAFVSSKRGRAFIRKEYDRGAWMYDGEADLGNGAAIRIAETILTNDPLFGWMAYGGLLTTGRRDFSIIPKDGLRNRFSIITDKIRVSLELSRDGFLDGAPLVVGSDLSGIRFTLENRTGDSHKTRFSVVADPGKSVRLAVDGKTVKPLSQDGRTTWFEIDIRNKTHSLALSY
ncbi:MAG: DUF5695 domain-containing protein [Bacteroidales bacterium]|nr:DUF5695 domain-containing protein [Bacteroidales bacterium]